jgi:proline racemase
MRPTFIDSHTAGEPTRLVLDGLPPDLIDPDPAVVAHRLGHEFGWLRRAIVAEPRGGDAWVGAITLPEQGLVLFNSAGPLGMCGHGTIGVVESLAWLGAERADSGMFRTPAGPVEWRRQAGEVAIDNVVSYRYRTEVAVEIPDWGTVTGDIAYGGNWFFLVEAAEEISLQTAPELTRKAMAIRRQLAELGITGANEAEIDHVEFSGPGGAGADARNFVLCPSGAYDRSPCGTGTSAKLACLAAEGRWPPGDTWVQESVWGGRFRASYVPVERGIRPTIVGAAYVMARGELVLEPDDPLREGFPA